MPAKLWLATRRSAKMRNRAVSAYAVPGGPCEWPSGIAPSYATLASNQTWHEKIYVPRTIILNVVLLDLLNVMVGLRVVHAFSVFPSIISEQAESWQHDNREPEGKTREQPWYHASVFHAEPKLRCDCRIYG